MNGGSASFAWPVKSGRVAIVGDLTIDGSTAPISSNNFNLTLAPSPSGRATSRQSITSPFNPSARRCLASLTPAGHWSPERRPPIPTPLQPSLPTSAAAATCASTRPFPFAWLKPTICSPPSTTEATTTRTTPASAQAWSFTFSENGVWRNARQ